MSTETTIDEIAIGGDPEEKNAKWGGLNTAVQDPRQLPLGVSPAQNNWITGRLQDNIQLRRGQALLGQTRRVGGYASGIGVGFIGSSQVAYYAANNSLYYYNGAANVLDTQEVGTNLLAGANDEDVWFSPYQNLAGFFMYLGSAHTSIFKIPLANPTSPVNQNPVQWFGNAIIDQGRMFGMQKYTGFGTSDLTNSYISNADKSASSSYPAPTLGESEGTGDGSTKTFTATLASLSAPLTAFAVVVGGALNAGQTITGMSTSGGLVTANISNTTGFAIGGYVMPLNVSSSGSVVNGNIGVITSVVANTSVTYTPYGPVASLTYSNSGTLYPLEVFQDNQQGVLTSNLGGTGTVNYATGALSVTFNTAPYSGISIIGNYYTENATSGGILDFSYNSGSPSYGQGYLNLQGASGPILASTSFQGIEYQFHLYRTWNVQLPQTSSSGYALTNQQYWSHIGIPYTRAAYATGDGVLYLDNTNPSEPKFSILEIPPNSTSLTIEPTWISQDLDLSTLVFSTAVVFMWGNYYILACQSLVNGSPQGYNTVFFIQDTESGCWNQLDYSVTSLAEFQGALISGDSLSPNAFTLFSGTDDDQNIIENYWQSSLTNLGLQGQKKVRYFYIQGLIQRPQSIQVSYSVDGGNFVPASSTNLPGGIIYGTGSYVNSSAPVGVGANTLGSTTIGAGSITALPFEIQIPVMTDYFEYIQIQFQALGIGWAQINKFGFRDIRHKSLKPPQYSLIEP